MRTKTTTFTKKIKLLAFALLFAASVFTIMKTDTQAAVKPSINYGKTVTMYVGQTKTLTFYGSSSKVKKYYTTSWSTKKTAKTAALKVVSNRSTVGKTVKIKALKAGTKAVRVKYNGKYYACKVVIKNKKRTTTQAAKSYTDYELYLMSHLINGEAGSNWISDAEQRAVGSVVLNRMKDSRFPNTMEGVIYQRGQYACTWDGNFNRTPSARVIANAKYILTHGSTLPRGVVFQSQSVQGPVYAKIGVHYFCY